MNAVGFTFVSLGGPSTTIDSVTLGNGDSYDIQTSFSSGGFFGVSSATGFTTATFHEQQFSSFGISDFRFGTTAVVPESGTFGLMGSALLAVCCALKRRVDRG